jgi:PAS domain S-box-containing protein
MEPSATDLYRPLFDHCSEAMFIVHRDGLQLVAANARLEELTGRARESLLGTSIGSLFAGEDPACTAHDILARPGLHEDVAINRIDGYQVFVALTVAHVDGGPLAACIARDTTERRLLERELIAKHTALHAAHAELGRMVETLTRIHGELEARHRELAGVSAELSRVTRRVLIGELSAGIAHSLNNPLAALASAHNQLAQVIERHGSDDMRAQAQRFVARSREAIARMEQTVQAVRRAHRSGRPSTELRRINLADEVETALTLFEGRLCGVRVHKQVDHGLTALTRVGDLQHVLWNLLDNAILAMPSGGVLGVEVALRADGAPVILVADDGDGVSPELDGQLFEPFVSTRPGGSGLGLSTARRLARDWGGDVRLVPRPRGACFEVSFTSKEVPWTAKGS